MKGITNLIAVDSNPTTGQFSFSITSCTNCSAEKVNVNTVGIVSAAADVATIEISINAENVNTYAKQITVGKVKPGEKGQSLTKSTPQWYASTSKTSPTGGSWVESMPTIDSSHYLWLRYKLDWENPTATTYTTPTLEQIAENIKEVSAKQVEFQQNLDGFKMTVSSTYATKGEIEKTLKNVTNEYYVSTSNSELIDGNWSTAVPTSQVNKYIWRREKSEFVDGSITYGDPICLTNESDEGYTIMLTKDTIVCLWDGSGDL